MLTAALRALALLLVVAGVGTLGLNLVGLTAGMEQRSAASRPAPPTGHEDWVSGSLEQRRGEPDLDYFRRLTQSVHYRITHTGEKYVVPAHENWILFGAHYVVGTYRDYEYADYHRALERGAGICTQYANAVFDVLKRQGFERRAVLWQRHAVVAARTRSGRELLLDADYGVVLPYTLRAARAEPSLVRKHYAALDPARTPQPHLSRAQVGEWAERAFTSPIVSVQAGDSTPNRARMERLAYVLKWPLPVVMLAIGLASLPALRRKRRTETPALWRG